MVLIAAAVIAVAGVFSMPPIAQDLAYHDFADKRALFGIPNFGNVAGNLAFAVAGVFGLLSVLKHWPRHLGVEFRLWLVFFASVFMVAFGSGYYHLAPDSDRLIWDRLPMVVAFMSFFSLSIIERVDEKWGARLFPVFLAAGAFSIWYWHHADDLRLYALVQFFPVLAILMIIAMFEPKYPGTAKYFFYTLGWYMAAKLLEHFDRGIFDALGGIVSGHTLKHLAAAAGVACMIGYVRSEKPTRTGSAGG